ncbi:MAG: hypothetical protein WCI74_03365 [Actinomycetes bacterium]
MTSDSGRGGMTDQSAVRLSADAVLAEVVDIRSAPSAHSRGPLGQPGGEWRQAGSARPQLRDLSERSVRLAVVFVKLASVGPRALGDPNLGMLAMHIGYRLSVVNAGWSSRSWGRL